MYSKAKLNLFLTAMFGCLFCYTCVAQESKVNTTTDHKHEICSGVGIASSTYVTAPSINVGYAYHIRKYSLKFSYHSAKQFSIIGKDEDPDRLYDLSLFARRNFNYKKLNVTIGAGVSSLHTHIATSSIIPGTIGTLEKTFTGLAGDLDFDLQTKNPLLHVGLNVHGSFNKAINFVDTNFYIAIRF